MTTETSDPASTSADSADRFAERDECADAAEADQPGARYDIRVNNEVDLPAAEVDWLSQQVRRVAGLCGLHQVDLDLVIVDDAMMSDLHQRFARVEGTTDVLTFDLREQSDGADVEGEIYICHDEAARQADQRRHPVRHELLLYAIHGLLHLLGYDDHEPADHQAMHAREDELLKRIGVGPVFQRDERGHR
jgi:probable rRNA maturation factor